MQISSRFTIAVHILACIDIFKDEYKVTSEFLSSSINVNPIIIRRILQQLKNAGIITVKRGVGGASIAGDLHDITFYDVYNAVECIDNGELFHFHEKPNIDCPVGRNIHNSLDDKLLRVQSAMEDEMKRISIFEVVEDTKKHIENNK